MRPASVYSGEAAVERLPSALASVQDRLAAANVCIVAQHPSSELANATRRSFLTTFPSMGLAASEVLIEDSYDLLHPDSIAKLQAASVAVKLIHGTANRTGQIQALLRSLRVRRTGHSVETDVIAQRKSLLKELMLANGVPTLPYAYAVGGGEATAELNSLLANDPGALYVVKPDGGNASEGILVLPGAGVTACTADLVGPHIIEPYAAGRVLTVGVASVGREIFVFPPIEYILDAGSLILDPSAKQSPTRTLAVGIKDEAIRRAQWSAATLHRAVGASGLSRSDFIVTADGTVMTLEINTNIGLSRHNDIAVVFEASHLSYEDLLWTHLASAFNCRFSSEEPLCA